MKTDHIIYPDCYIRTDCSIFLGSDEESMVIRLPMPVVEDAGLTGMPLEVSFNEMQIVISLGWPMDEGFYLDEDYHLKIPFGPDLPFNADFTDYDFECEHRRENGKIIIDLPPESIKLTIGPKWLEKLEKMRRFVQEQEQAAA